VEGRIAPVLEKTIAIDMHNHVYPTGTEPHPQFGPSPQGPPPQEPPSLPLGEELKQSGLTAVCAAITIDFAPNKKPGDARDYFLHWLDALDRELEQAHIHRALTLHDIETAHTRQKPTIIQSTEGAHFLEGHLDRLEEVYKRGLRHLQPLHDRDDLIAPLGDVITNPPHLGGLTPLGAEVIQECNRLGILVDMAHASPETVLGALKVAKHPILVSHTNLDNWTGKDLRMAQMMKPHLISKEHAKIIADAGGVVGVWTHLTDSLQEFVQSIKAMVDAIGVDHVGIGTDTDLLNPRNGTNHAWPGFTDSFFPAVVAQMLLHGFTPEEIAKIGGANYCRLFDQATATNH
ncbi:MAG TPA: membrane dipeptidase, partial [Acidobacteriaceae bacterium]